MSRLRGVMICLLLLSIAACSGNMADQSRYKPLEASDYFPDGQSSRPLVDGTVPRGAIVDNPVLITGMENGGLTSNFPLTLDSTLIERGQERYDIYCSVCHGLLGYGEGMIVQRGFPQPPSFHDQRLREAPNGHFFDVITDGFGVMYSYASRVPVMDRWAIIAYIRALQLSQNASPDSLDQEDQEALATS